MKYYFILFFGLFLLKLPGQSDSAKTSPSSLTHFVKVHFLHGSKPAKAFKGSETNWFGGIHGGHVYLELDSTVFSFSPTSIPVHIFAHRRHFRSHYHDAPLSDFALDTAKCTVTSIQIPVSDSQYFSLCRIRDLCLDSVPYDYAFFGMRCAAAAYDVLAESGVLPAKSNFGIVCRYFYPQLLRRKLTRQSESKNWKIELKMGRKSRKWEKM
jgi:hypothetical protein